MILNAINHILANDATVSSLTGLNSREDKPKVYPVVAPSAETEPYIVTRVAGRDRMGKDSSCGYTWTVEVASYAKSRDEALELSEAARTAIEGQAAGTVNGVSFGSAEMTNDEDGFDKDHECYYRLSTYTAITG